MSIDFDTPGTDDEQPDWLTDSAIGEEAEGGDGEDGNRLFLIIAIGLIGLIVLGLFAVGGLLFIRNLQQSQAIADLPTPTQQVVVEEVIPTATFTPIPPSPAATSTPTIAPTNTRVIQDGGNGEGNGDGQAGEGNGGAQATPTPGPTNTPVPVATPAGGTGEVPPTGFGGFEVFLIAIGLVAVVVVTRRLRHAV